MSSSDTLDELPSAASTDSDTPSPHITNRIYDNALSVQLLLDAAPGCGGIAWPAGDVLAQYLARRYSHTLNGKAVLELGSGTGLVGLVAAKLGANVLITDQLPLLGIMHSNVKLNQLESRVQIAQLNWGEPIPDTIPNHLDLILAADCVYFEPAFPLLIDTLCALVRRQPEEGAKNDGAQEAQSNHPEVLFCYKKRRKADKRFFALLKKHFDWRQVDDDPDYPTYSREAISLFRLTLKKSSS